MALPKPTPYTLSVQGGRGARVRGSGGIGANGYFLPFTFHVSRFTILTNFIDFSPDYLMLSAYHVNN